MDIQIRYDDDQGRQQNVRYRLDADDALAIAARGGYQPLVRDAALTAAYQAKMDEAAAVGNTDPRWEVLIAEAKMIERQLRTLVPNPASVEAAAAAVLEDFIADGLVDGKAVQDAGEQARKAEQATRRQQAKTKIKQP